MTKSEYRKELYSELHKIFNEHIEEADRRQPYARNDLDKGKWVGIRTEAKRMKQILIEKE